MVSKRTLYGNHMSPSTRAVRMTLAALDLDYEFKVIDVPGGENRTPEYLKKNPQHTIPTLEDEDGFCAWDSHAIMAYLVRKYGKNDELYPKDFQQRAVVDQRLHYECGALFVSVGQKVCGAILRGSATKEQLPEMRKTVEDSYELMDKFVDDNEFIAGKQLTIADFSIGTMVSVLICFVPIDAEKYPKLSAWFNRFKKLPYYDLCNEEGFKMLYERIQEKLKELS